MWKTLSAKPSWKHSNSVLALCPQCDALGPHPTQGQAVACIDCGQWLGRLRPDGFLPFELETELEPAAGGALERVQAKRILQEVRQHAQAGHGRLGSRYALLLGLGV